jgi:hypothetical protein
VNLRLKVQAVHLGALAPDRTALPQRLLRE